MGDDSGKSIWGNCVPDDNLNQYSDSEGRYSIHLCKHNCKRRIQAATLESRIAQNCHCRSNSSIAPVATSISAGLPICATIHPNMPATDQSHCEFLVHKAIDATCERQCYTACNEDSYDSQVSSTALPALNGNFLDESLTNWTEFLVNRGTFNQNSGAPYPDAMKYYVDNGNGNYTSTHSLGQMYMRHNMVSMNLFYRTLRVLHKEEFAAMDFYDLFGQVGGNAGLLSGISCFTICEFLEFGLVGGVVSLAYAFGLRTGSEGGSGSNTKGAQPADPAEVTPEFTPYSTTNANDANGKVHV